MKKIWILVQKNSEINNVIVIHTNKDINDIYTHLSRYDVFLCKNFVVPQSGNLKFEGITYDYVVSTQLGGFLEEPRVEYTIREKDLNKHLDDCELEWLKKINKNIIVTESYKKRWYGKKEKMYRFNIHSDNGRATVWFPTNDKVCQIFSDYKIEILEK